MRALAPLAAALLFALAGCSTIDSRIAKNPEAFAALSPDHQTLVRQGRVVQGMPQPAVFMAWGSADGVARGQRNGRYFETWIYDRIYQDIVPDYGYIRHRVGDHTYFDTVYAPITITRRFPYKWARFSNGKVTDWEIIGASR